MRWIVLGTVLLIGAVAALFGRNTFGPSEDAPAAPDRPDPRRDAGAPDEVPRLSGHSAGEAPARPTGPTPPTAAADGTADLRLRLRTADAEGARKILAEIQDRGPSAASLVGDLFALLQHEDARVRLAAADALASIGRAVVEPLLKAVIEEYERLGASGAHSSWASSWGPYILAKVGEPAVVPVAKTLGHRDAYFWALVTFERLAVVRAPMSGAVEVVLERLRDVQTESPLCFVIDAVPYLGSSAPRAVPRLVELLRDPRPQVRIQAAKALGRIGPDASAASTELGRLRAEASEREGTWIRVLEEAIARIRGAR